MQISSVPFNMPPNAVDSFSGAPAVYNRFPNLESADERIIYYILSPNNKTPEALKATYKIWKLLYYDDIDALNKELPSYKDVIKLICNNNITQTNFKIFRSPHFSSAWTQQNMILKVYVDQILPTDRYKAVVNYGIDVICNSQIINVRSEMFKWKRELTDKDKEYIEKKKIPNLKDDEGWFLFAPALIGEDGNFMFDEGEDEDNVHIHPIAAPIDYVEYERNDEGAVNEEVHMEPIYPEMQSRVATMTQAILCVLNGANIQSVGMLEFSLEMSRFNQAHYSIWNNRNFEGIKLVMGSYMGGVS